MKPMGALQPGIPSPTTIPQNWHIIIIDFQDCFFNIPLHPLEYPSILARRIPRTGSWWATVDGVTKNRTQLGD